MKLITSKSILNSHNGMNIYRGCTHGCIYCDSRSKCYHNPEPFEDIEAKQNAPELLRLALQKKRKKCMIGTGSMSDPYLHAEENLLLTRRCLEVINELGFGISILTKSSRILRDLDLLDSINKKARVVLQMTITTFDDELCKILEPNVCTTKERFEVLKIFKSRGIETVVWITPFLPFINDNIKNLSNILESCKNLGVSGIIDFGMGLTLREGDREYFYKKLDEHFPLLKQKYLKTYGWNKYELASPNQNELLNYFKDFCTKNKIICNPYKVFDFLNEFPDQKNQLELF